MRAPYDAHPQLIEQVFDLLETAFEGVRTGRSAAERLDWHWQDISMPFVTFEAGALIAHVGVLELPLWVEGKRVLVGGVHAVVTAESHRLRGHARRLLEEALAWCDERYESVVLSTADPGVYEGVGFRVLQECFFRTEHNVPGHDASLLSWGPCRTT